jgi:hypothetical protein
MSIHALITQGADPPPFLYASAESFEWFIEDQAFLPPYGSSLTPPPPPPQSKLAIFLSIPAWRARALLTREGGG